MINCIVLLVLVEIVNDQEIVIDSLIFEEDNNIDIH